MKTDHVEALLLRIIQDVNARRPPRDMRTKIIRVDGAGKSTFAERLATALGGAQIVHTDDFASWDNPINWWPALLRDVLEPVSQGRTGQFTRSLWTPRQQRSRVDVAPSSHLIVEGVTVTRDAFRPYLTYSIWVETPRNLRLSRGLARDGEEARAQWEQWMAEEDTYVQRERPHDKADLVIHGGQDLWQ